MIIMEVTVGDGGIILNGVANFLSISMHYDGVCELLDIIYVKFNTKLSILNMIVMIWQCDSSEMTVSIISVRLNE